MTSLPMLVPVRPPSYLYLGVVHAHPSLIFDSLSYVYLTDKANGEGKWVWCEVGEHSVVPDDHWDSVYPGFADCFQCCTENEFLEVTGLERNETGDIIDKDGQVLLTAAGYTAAEKKVAGTFTLYSLSLSRNVLDSVLNSVLCR